MVVVDVVIVAIDYVIVVNGAISCRCSHVIADLVGIAVTAAIDMLAVDFKDAHLPSSDFAGIIPSFPSFLPSFLPPPPPPSSFLPPASAWVSRPRNPVTRVSGPVLCCSNFASAWVSRPRKLVTWVPGPLLCCSTFASHGLVGPETR